MKEDGFYTHRSLETRGTAQHSTEGHMEKHQGQSEDRGSNGKMWVRAFLEVSIGKDR